MAQELKPGNTSCKPAKDFPRAVDDSLVSIGASFVVGCQFFGFASRWADLSQAELSADQSDRGDYGGFAAQHAGAEVHEREAVSAQCGAVRRPPAALGTEGETGGLVT
jgi:hypothetical protein